MRRVIIWLTLALLAVAVPTTALAHPHKGHDPVRPTSATIFSFR